jgi:hypothetical protein
MLNGLGWLATALFATSYFCKTSRAMRRLQASAALLWVGYGIWMNAPPIIVANVIVAALAVYSDWKQPQFASACDSAILADMIPAGPSDHNHYGTVGGSEWDKDST